jgi:hypothetical protein
VSIRTFHKQGSVTAAGPEFLNRDARVPRGSSDPTISVEESASWPLRSHFEPNRKNRPGEPYEGLPPTWWT